MLGRSSAAAWTKAQDIGATAAAGGAPRNPAAAQNSAERVDAHEASARFDESLARPTNRHLGRLRDPECADRPTAPSHLLELPARVDLEVGAADDVLHAIDRVYLPDATT